jgi:4-alpha-glucanotransferase
MFAQRSAGVLLHPTCLPGPYGVGELGAAARQFIDQLALAEMRYWQVLPLNPTGAHPVMYSATSSFAGNTLLLDIETLIAQGLLTKDEATPLRALRSDRFDANDAIPARERALARAGRRLAGLRDGPLAQMRDAFAQAHGEAWLNDYALWEALSRSQGRRHWIEWADALRLRDEAALNEARAVHAEEIAAIVALQALFDAQWTALRAYGAERGVRLIGDMPIFVAHDSADVWQRPALFKLDAQSRCISVAGVPPDYFSATGQLWGNPVYRWDAMAEDGYAWWIARTRRLLEMVDCVRIDHFRGFAATWETPAGAPTAAEGRWEPAGGHALFAALQKEFPQMPFIAEDLGHITEDVIALRDAYGLPGLKILQFVFGDGPPRGDNDPRTFPVRSVCYPSTHDNNTMLGWLRNDGLEAAQRASDAPREAAAAREATGVGDQYFADAVIAMAMQSGSTLAIVQLQDVLGLDGSARMNTPGTVNDDNWTWRFGADDITPDHIAKLAHAVRVGGRGARPAGVV